MTDYTITSPDGKSFTLSGPPGATPQQLKAKVQALQQHPLVAGAATPAGQTPRQDDPRLPAMTPDPEGEAAAYSPNLTQTEQAKRDVGKAYFNPLVLDATKPSQDQLTQKRISEARNASAETLPLSKGAAFNIGNPVEQYKTLVQQYGEGNVKRDFRGFYIVKDGHKVYPRAGLGAHAATAAPDILLGGAGAAIGEAAGGPVAAAAGSGMGTGLSQGLKDAYLSYLGVYDKAPGEEVRNIGVAAAAGGVGEAAGRAVMSGGGAGIRKVGALKNRITGLDPEKGAIAKDLAKQGYAVEPGGYVPALKRGQRQVEQARLVAGYDPTQAGAKKYATKAVQDLLESGGASPDKASAEIARLKVPAKEDLRPAGAQLQEAARSEFEGAKAELSEEQKKARSEIEAKAGIDAKALETEQGAAKSRVASLQARLDQSINEGLREIQAIRRSSRPGQLAVNTAAAIKRKIEDTTAKFNELYSEAIAKARGAQISTDSLADVANQIRQTLPEEFRKAFPVETERLERMDSGMKTVEEIHNLRTILRNMSRSSSLSPDWKKSILARASKQVDDVLHLRPYNIYGRIGALKSTPGVKPRVTDEAAVKAMLPELDKTDRLYAKDIKFRNSAILQHITDSIRDGMPPDPGKILDVIRQEGETSSLRAIQKLGGAELVKGIQRADADQIIKASLKDLESADGPITGKTISGARLVKALKERGSLLDAVHGKEAAERMRTTAKRLARLGGELNVGSLDIDRFSVTLDAWNRAKMVADRIADKSPLDALGGEFKKSDNELARQFSARYSAGNDVLAFLRNGSTLEDAAAEKVLGNEQLLEQAQARFKGDSPAMQSLRKVAFERTVGPVLRGEGGGSLVKAMKQLTPKQQEILFPGGQAQDLLKVSAALDVMTAASTKAAPGIAAGQTLGKPLFGYLKLAAYHELMSYLWTRPTTVRFLASDLSGFMANPGRTLQMLKAATGALGRAAGQEIGSSTPYGQSQGSPEGIASLPPLDRRAARPAGQSYRDLIGP